MELVLLKMTKNKAKSNFKDIFEYYDVKKKEEISEFCSDNVKVMKASIKNLGFKLFMILFSSVIIYTGLIQIIIPYIYENFEIETWHIFIIITSFVFVFAIFFVYSYLRKNFNIMRWLIYISFYAFVSIGSNIVVTVILSVSEFGEYEILIRFSVGLIFSFLLVFISFIITRKIICRVEIVDF
jgi:hypothetical protein